MVAVTRDPVPPTVTWRDGRVRLVDQRALPDRLRHVECTTVTELCSAIVVANPLPFDQQPLEAQATVDQLEAKKRRG